LQRAAGIVVALQHLWQRGCARSYQVWHLWRARLVCAATAVAFCMKAHQHQMAALSGMGIVGKVRGGVAGRQFLLWLRQLGHQ